MDRLASKIRSLPDFPKPGVVFRDVTPLLRDPSALRECVELLVEPFRGRPVTAVVGMEARGFVFGSLVAWELGVGFVPFRKAGKLPCDVASVNFDLEYGSATLETDRAALGSNDRVLLVDDLLATGGTAAASGRLVEQLGATIEGYAFVIELDSLGGRGALGNTTVHSLLSY